MLSWGILMIIGVIIARHFKERDPLWFYLHVGIQSSAFTLGIVGIICGFILEDKVSANVSTHKGLGIFILVLGCLQVCLYYEANCCDLFRLKIIFPIRCVESGCTVILLNS